MASFRKCYISGALIDKIDLPTSYNDEMQEYDSAIAWLKSLGFGESEIVDIRKERDFFSVRPGFTGARLIVGAMDNITHIFYIHPQDEIDSGAYPLNTFESTIAQACDLITLRAEE